MALNDRNICNTDLLQSSKFIFTIPRLAEVQFFCQAANIPGVNTQSTVQLSPFKDMSVPGDKMEYEDLNVEFLLDEELKSWSSILLGENTLSMFNDLNFSTIVSFNKIKI